MKEKNDHLRFCWMNEEMKRSEEPEDRRGVDSIAIEEQQRLVAMKLLKDGEYYKYAGRVVIRSP